MASSSSGVAAMAAVVAVMFAPCVCVAQDDCGRWAPLPALPGLNDVEGGYVLATTLWDRDGDGPEAPVLVAAGSFSAAGALTINNIARWDGASWHAMDAGVAGGVYALQVHAGELYAAGNFEADDRTPAPGAARWNGDAWELVGSSFDSFPLTLASHAGDLYVGGYMTRIGKEAIRYIARLDKGVWTRVGNPGPGTGVNALRSFNGELVAAAGAGFSAWNGAAWRQLASPPAGWLGTYALHVYDGALYAGGLVAGNASVLLRFDGSAWTAVTPSSYRGNVRAFTEYEGDLVFGGLLTSNPFGGPTNLFGWDGAALFAFEPSPSQGVYTLVSDADAFYAGGNFSRFGATQAAGIARCDGDSWDPLGPGLTGGRVRALVMHGGTLYAGGSIGDGSGLPSLAAWDGEQLSHLGRLSSPAFFVNDMIEFDSRLVVAGNFTSIDGVPVPGLGVLDNDTWSSLGAGPPVSTQGRTSGRVRALAIQDGALLAAGVMQGGAVVRWDGTQWSPISPTGLVAPSSRIGEANAMTLHGSDIIVGGWFESAGGARVENVARWDGAAWRPLGAGLGSSAPWNEEVFALLSADGTIYAGGALQRSGATTVRNVAQWDGSAWRPMGEGLDGPVHALAHVEGEIWAGGDFTRSGSTIVIGLARWDGSAWAAVDGGVTGGGAADVRALLPRGTDVVIGGEFTRAGEVASRMWARRVLLAADFNHDRRVDSADFFDFLVQFFEGSPQADFNTDGVVNSSDFFDFLAHFFATC